MNGTPDQWRDLARMWPIVEAEIQSIRHKQLATLEGSGTTPTLEKVREVQGILQGFKMVSGIVASKAHEEETDGRV